MTKVFKINDLITAPESGYFVVTEIDDSNFVKIIHCRKVADRYGNRISGKKIRKYRDYDCSLQTPEKLALRRNEEIVNANFKYNNLIKITNDLHSSNQEKW